MLNFCTFNFFVVCMILIKIAVIQVPKETKLQLLINKCFESQKFCRYIPFRKHVSVDMWLFALLILSRLLKRAIEKAIEKGNLIFILLAPIILNYFFLLYIADFKNKQILVFNKSVY